MSFLNPLFLFGLAAAAIPVIIHLFTRRRPKEIRFPSLEFLSEVNQSEIRRLKLRQWLLLLLRTLAVAMLALAMARPALKGSVGLKSGAGTTVVVLADQSGSMTAAGGGPAGGMLVDQARRVVEDLLGALGPQDEIQIVPYDAAPHPVTQHPSADLGRMRAAAQSLAQTALTTHHIAALTLAGRTLAEAKSLNRELFWISDFQRAGFLSPPAPGEGAGAAAATPAGFTVPAGPWDRARAYLVPLEPRSRANAMLSDASLAPTEGSAALSVSGISFGAPPGDLAVEVREARAGQELGRGFLDMPERGEVSTLLPLARLPEQGGVANIPDDALALDNARYFAAGRAGTLHILVREDAGPSPLRLALEAGSPASGLEVEAVDGAVLPQRLRDADALVIHDVERLGSVELQAVLDYYRAGGAVLLVPGARADAAFWNGSLLHELKAGTLGATETAAPGAAWRLTRTVAGHPVLAGFPTRPGEPLSNARFGAVRAFVPGPETRALLVFDRAHPALVEAPHALLFLAPLDPQTTDFPMSGAFLPLVHQAAKVLARGTAASSLVPGDRYSAPASTGVWRIEDDAGREVATELVSERGATRLRSAPLERPGLYRVLQGGQLRSTFAVNLDPRESDLAAMPEDALLRAFPNGRAQVVHAGADLARRVREARYGRELWGWFIALALLMLVAESVLARWGMEGAGAQRAA